MRPTANLHSLFHPRTASKTKIVNVANDAVEQTKFTRLKHFILSNIVFITIRNVTKATESAINETKFSVGLLHSFSFLACLSTFDFVYLIFLDFPIVAFGWWEVSHLHRNPQCIRKFCKCRAVQTHRTKNVI